jgi:DUF1680 family protein
MTRIARSAGVLLVLAMPVLPAVAPTAEPQPPRAPVTNRVAFRAVSFSLEDVRLLDGPFKDAMVRDGKYLLELEPDRLLHMFRVTAGLPSTAQPYGQPSWEAPETELRGHTTGHYLSALAIMYASTGDRRFKDRADLMVTELDRVQQAEAATFHAGYLSAFPEEFFDRVDKRVNVWAPYYTIHKIMAGLFDVSQLCHNALALDMLKKQAGWVRFRVDRLSHDEQQAALQTEFGGMGEVLANLAGVTGDPEWLRVAQKFDHEQLFDPLAEGRDPLVNDNGRGLHGNTQIPKMIASAREYELTAEPRYKAIATNFWHTVVEKRSYVIGGNTDGESFFPVDTFEQHLGTSSAETCNTYNMLKLTRHLFSWEPTAETMDFYERALLNQILPSQDPKTGGVVYYTPLRPGAFKVFSLPNDSFWCCVGTGMENHGKYNDTIYFHDDQSLYLNLFIPSELTWTAKGLSVRQETRFPTEATTRLSFTAAKPVTLALKVRYPSWASGMTLSVNGRNMPVAETPGSYVTVNRTWKTGDTVSVSLPMTLHVEPLPHSTTYAAFMYGPVVLAGDLGSAGMENARRYGSNTPQATLVPPAAHVDIPVFVSADLTKDLAKIRPVPGAPLTFKAVGITQPTDVTLVPFFTLFEPRYTIYWKVYSPADWDARTKAAAADAARRQNFASRTIDAVDVGSDESERSHGLTSQTSGRGRGAAAATSPPPVGPAGPTLFDGRRGREARGGFISYALKVTPGLPATLAVTYRVETATQPRSFDVLVDGTKVATETLAARPGEFFDKEYPLASDLTRGKSQVTVRFESAGTQTTATVFDVRTVRQPD